MKKIISLIIFIIPSFAFSQLPNTTYATSYAGVSFPTNQPGYSASFNGGINLEFATSPMTVLGFDANFGNLPSKESLNHTRHTFGGSGYPRYNYVSYNTLGVSTFFKVQNVNAMTLPVQPFVKLGVGFSLVSQLNRSYLSTGEIETFPSANSLGFLLAPSMGMNVVLKGKNKLVFEAQYRINTSGLQDVHFFLINAGYSFKL